MAYRANGLKEFRNKNWGGYYLRALLEQQTPGRGRYFWFYHVTDSQGAQVSRHFRKYEAEAEIRKLAGANYGKD